MPDRREFLAWTLATGAVLTPATDSAAGENDPAAASKEAAKKDAAEKDPEKPDKEATSAVVAADDPAELWLARVKQAYPGDKLSADDVSEIRADIARYLAASKQLSAFPLENGDAPATLFRVIPTSG